MIPELARRHLQACLLAVRFLTTLPTPASRAADERLTGLSLLWYPAVGLLLGLVLAWLCQVLPLPVNLLAAVVVAVWVGLTGGLHLDGLADCADAWVGGLGDRERTLRLLGDPLAGSMAVITLTLLLLLKCLALGAMISGGAMVWLWAVPLMARASLLPLFATTEYVRPGGLGAVLAQQFSPRWGWRVLAAVVGATMFYLPPVLWGALWTTVLGVFLLVRWCAVRRLGGFTGDVAGAQVELVETALLLVLAAQGAS